MSRWVYMLGLGLALVTLAFAATGAVLGPPPGVTEASAKRVREGMTVSEVDAIFGKPGRCYWAVGRCSGHNLSKYEWSGVGGTASVSFVWKAGEAPAVVNVSFQRTVDANPLSRLRAWLGW